MHGCPSLIDRYDLQSGVRVQTSTCRYSHQWPLTAVSSRNGPRPRNINLRTAPVGRFRWISSFPTSTHPPSPSHSHSLIFLFLASGTLYTPQTFSAATRSLPTPTHHPPLEPPTLLPHSTNPYSRFNSLIPIMSIRRNNVRVSFLLNDSESSFELCVSDKISR